MQNYVKLLFFLLPFCLFGQDRSIDSLKFALKNAKHDTIKCLILSELTETASDEEWPAYNQQLKKFCEVKLKEYSSKQPLYKFYYKYLAGTYNNFGYLSQQKGKIPEALNYFFEGLKMQEIIGDKNGQAVSLNNIAAIYDDQKDFSKALEYYAKSLKLREAIWDKKGVSESLNNIGGVYKNQRNFTMALKFFKKSLTLRESIGYKMGIATCLNNIGGVYNDLGNFDEAFKCLDRCLKIQEHIGDNEGIALSLNNIATFYTNKKKYNEALVAALKGMEISKRFGFRRDIMDLSLSLNRIYRVKNDYKNALQSYELYIQMRDSLSNQETRKASIKSQLKYEYEKKAGADSVKVAEEKKLTTVKLKQEKTQRYYLYGGLSLTALFGIFMFNRFRITQKQKNVIEKQKTLVETQKHIVDEKQKETLDSIRYAKRIQQSLLPTEKFIDRVLKNKI